MKPKVLITSFDLEIGGAERSLLGLLNSFDYTKYEVDLFLYAHAGEFMSLLPKSLNLLPEVKPCAMLRIPIVTALCNGAPFIAISRIISKFVALIQTKTGGCPGDQLLRNCRYCLPFFPRIPKKYDLAISFTSPHYLMTDRVTAKVKIGWIHIDYTKINSGVDKNFERPMWQRLDIIAAVSAEVKNSFIQVFPELRDKVLVIENILSAEFVRQQADALDVAAEMPAEPGVIRLCSVGRFCHAKNFDSVPEVVRLLMAAGVSSESGVVSRESSGQVLGQAGGLADHGTAPRWSSPFRVCKETEPGHSCPVMGKSGLENPGSVFGCGSAAPCDPWSNQASVTLHPNSKIENRKSKITLKWYLIGYGGDEALIRQKIAAAGVGDQVIILGKKTNPYPYMKACDLYVQPSRYEGKAVTVREAQMLGKPVLITNFPTAKSQLEDGIDGLICPLDNAAIADAIQRLIEDRELRTRLAQTAAARDYSNAGEVEKIYGLMGAGGAG